MARNSVSVLPFIDDPNVGSGEISIDRKDTQACHCHRQRCRVPGPVILSLGRPDVGDKGSGVRGQGSGDKALAWG